MGVSNHLIAHLGNTEKLNLREVQLSLWPLSKLSQPHCPYFSSSNKTTASPI